MGKLDRDPVDKKKKDSKHNPNSYLTMVKRCCRRHERLASNHQGSYSGEINKVLTKASQRKSFKLAAAKQIPT